MFLRLVLTIFFLFSMCVNGAVESLDFRNDREGVSLYATKSNNKKINSLLKKIDSQVILNSYENSLRLQTEKNVCAYNLNESLIKDFGLKRVTKAQYEGALYYLRSQNLIDDVVTQILLNAYNVTTKTIYQNNDNHRSPPGNKTQREALYKLLNEFSTKYLAYHCYDEAYRLLFNDLNKIITLTDRGIRDLFVTAKRQRIINDELYQLLERGRIGELQYKSVGLKDYYQKLKNLRMQYPLPFEEDYSDLVTQTNTINLTHRQQILAQYSDLQIIMMGNLIKKLRARLESDRIEIWVYEQDGEIEIIPLDPMERFRFSLKILRKEMSSLSLNTQFQGRTPSYMDLIAASFEIGLIAGSELDELASLEEVWNPKKTFWDKASFWIRSFGSVATIMIPPPYGFVPVLALIAIESTMTGKDTSIDDGSLF